MSTPKVSVIIPSLNTGKYLRECLDSVLGQTLYDLEVLFVDAGSTDDTLSILQEFMELDKRIRLIQSDKKSYGYQINIGISQVRGEYVSIVEPDDFTDKDMFMQLYQRAVKYNLDYVKGKPMGFFGSKEAPISFEATYVDNTYIDVLLKPRKLPQLLKADIFLWDGLYKRDFIKKVRLNETPGAAFQDQFFLLSTISSARRAMYTAETVYYYRQDNQGSSINASKGFQNVFNEYKLNEPIAQSMSSEWRQVFYYRLMAQIISRMELMSASLNYWISAEEYIDKLHDMIVAAQKRDDFNIDELDAWMFAKYCLFEEDPRLLYGFMKSDYLLGCYQLKKLIIPLKDKEIIIFGTGKYATICTYLLNNQKDVQIRIVAACDNNESRLEKRWNDMVVLSPEEAAKKYPHAYFILAAKDPFRKEMRRQLRNLNIFDNQIVDYMLGHINLNYFKIKSLNIQTIGN